MLENSKFKYDMFEIILKTCLVFTDKWLQANCYFKRLKQNRLVMQCIVITCGATDESNGHSEFKSNFCSQIGIYVTKYKIGHCMQFLTTLQYHPKTKEIVK